MAQFRLEGSLQGRGTVLAKAGARKHCVQGMTESRLSGMERKLNRLTGPVIFQIMLSHTTLHLTEKILQDNE